MDKMTEHEKLKEKLPKDRVKRMNNSPAPNMIARELLEETPAQACAYLDAARKKVTFAILTHIKKWAMHGNDDAAKIVTLADELGIKGEDEDKEYRKTIWQDRQRAIYQ